MSVPVHAYKASKKITLAVAELRVGMRVIELDRPWEGTPFLFQGFTVESEDDIELLRELCAHVVVDVESTVQFKLGPHARSGTGADKSRNAVVVNKPPVERELVTAQTTYRDSSRLLRTIVDDIRLGRAIDTPTAREAVESCVDSILRSPDALLLLTNIKNKDDYTAQHSLNVSILTIALGRHMGLEQNQLVDLGMCALLHDVGKVLTPDEVLNKRGQLTDEEFEIMKRHTIYGRDILMSTSGTPMAALDVAHGHHEALDGSGYPRALTGDSLTLWTRAVAVTDTFDAVTSDRIYSTGRTSLDALRILNQGRGTRYDTNLVMKFVRAVGLFPPGSVVELSNGEIGVVLQTHPKLQLRPRLLVVRQPGDVVSQPRIVDLSKVMADQQGYRLNIVRMLRPEQAGVDLQAIRDSGLIQTTAAHAGPG